MLTRGVLDFQMTACWCEDKHIIENEQKLKLKTDKSLDYVNRKLRKWDSKSWADWLKNIRRYTIFQQHRRKLARQRQELDDAFPPDERLMKGINNMWFLKEGVIAVKREDQYHWIGTFTFRDFQPGLAGEKPLSVQSSSCSCM